MRTFVGDFGLGKVLHMSVKAGRTTMRAGTPAFQPPEQLKGEEVGVASDVYALGCVIIETFGEEHVWNGLSPHTIILKVAVESAFPSTAHLPQKVKAIADMCLVPRESRKTSIKVLMELCKMLDP